MIGIEGREQSEALARPEGFVRWVTPAPASPWMERFIASVQ
jgi:hypothetical protein